FLGRFTILLLDALSIIFECPRQDRRSSQRRHLIGIRTNDHRHVVLFAPGKNGSNLVGEYPSIDVGLGSEFLALSIIVKQVDDFFSRYGSKGGKGIAAGCFCERGSDFLSRGQSIAIILQIHARLERSAALA